MSISTRKIRRLDQTMFELRWLVPLAVLVDSLLKVAFGQSEAFSVATLGVTFTWAAYNLLLVLANSPGSRQPTPPVVPIALDSLLAIATVTLLGPNLVWVALLPVTVAGARFGTLPGLLMAAGVVLGSATGVLVRQGTALSPETLAPLAMGGLLLPLAGILASHITTWARTRPSGPSRPGAEQQLREAREQMRVVYEMAATLSASLNYERVLDMVLDVCVHGLKRLGVSTRLSAAILLFTQDGGETFLRVAAYRRLTPSDARAQVQGTQGAIADALARAEPVVCREPHDDPEIKYFAGLREARTVLCVPMRAGFDSFGVMLVGLGDRHRLRENHLGLLQAIANQAVVSLQNASLYQSLLEEKERIVEVDEDARKQLARDLHDGPTQTIAAVAMRTSIIRRVIDKDPSQAADEMWKVEELARKAASEIRHMLFTLRPLVLESRGLVAALEQLAAKMEETYSQRVSIESEPDVEHFLDENAQGVIFYIVEEAVNNARKHAEAEVINVRLGVQSDVVLVEISDQGKGFDLEAIEEKYDVLGSLGMVNLRERAQLVEGTLHIDTAPGKGTRVSVLVPLERKGGKLQAAGQSASERETE